MADFRYEDLDIWKDSIDIADTLFDYAERAESKNHYRFAEQLRGAALSISNNIAEGAGSFSKNELFGKLKYLSQRITNFRKTILK